MSLEIDSVLAQIRSLSSQARVGTSQATAPQKSGPSEFANLLSKGIDSVNQTQLSAGKLADAFQRGDPGVELPQVMIEMQKASTSFRALTEVRNRMVSAYQEIMNMQV
ncbi:MAG: flagellar hook-basal body complex protein FliE [Gammaproteobacteria bacterium]|jgi:flagellar hook-basal body complex protein FliE|nr:flagellar hook-basal body complex protein FliE [Gammaproteobacteria bacterium]